VSNVDIWRKNILIRGKCRWKGSEEGVCMHIQETAKKLEGPEWNENKSEPEKGNKGKREIRPKYVISMYRSGTIKPNNIS
jgi:hypothetical protein